MKINVITLSLGFLLIGIVKNSSANEISKTKLVHSSFHVLQSDTLSEYEKFKKDSKTKIRNNEKKIDDLKRSMDKESKAVKDKYKDRIAQIEQKNKDMKKKITDYKKDQDNSKWDAFKRDFNTGMDELGQSIEDLTSDYRK